MNATFEDKLLGQLKQVVTERAAEPVTRRHWRPRLALAGAVAATAAIGIAAPVLVADRTSPAWAVTVGEDGWVRVTIQELRDAEGLERRLEELGIAAEVDFFPPEAGGCLPGRYTGVEADQDQLRVDMGATGPVGGAFSIRPEEFRSGETLVVETSNGTRRDRDGSGPEFTFVSLTVGVAEGPVAPCEPAPGLRGHIER
jgi:hypothetical protein